MSLGDGDERMGRARFVDGGAGTLCLTLGSPMSGENDNQLTIVADHRGATVCVTVVHVVEVVHVSHVYLRLLRRSDCLVTESRVSADGYHLARVARLAGGGFRHVVELSQGLETRLPRVPHAPNI